MARTFFALTAAALAGIATLAAPAHAATPEGWDVAPAGPDACIMSAVFGEDGQRVTLALLRHSAEGRLEILAAGDNWQDLRQRSGASAPFELTFDGKVPYSQWLAEKAAFTRIGGGLDAVVGDWGAEHSGELAKAVTGSDSVTVKVGDTTLGRFDLTGAQQAYGELLRCGQKG